MTTDPDRPQSTPRRDLATFVASVAFGVAIVGGIAFAVSYLALRESRWLTQALGVSAMVGFGGIGAGLVVWAQGAMPLGPHVQDRETARMGSTHVPDEVRTALRQDTDGIGRRSLLSRLLVAALGTVGLSSLVPLLSLGPTEAEAEEDDGPTRWTAGRRLVQRDGSPIARDDVPLGGAITATPEGVEPEASSQVMLVRLGEDGQVDVGSGRSEWTAAGYVAYSRLCSHMGCAVGLYQVQRQSLVCPCHQSAFLVADGARPEFGPATRPLPQLPLDVDDEGFLIAAGDFDRPVGTATWDHPARIEDRP